jgi:DNA excision repair protein ERCC-2
MAEEPPEAADGGPTDSAEDMFSDRADDAVSDSADDAVSDSADGATSDPAGDATETTGFDDLGDLEDAWQQYFGFPEPYDNQADAVRSALQVGRANGYLAMEGPCGTGKTMAALAAAGTLVRETDQYDTVVVVTPVKQQLQQFVDDLRTLNAGLEEPLTGVSLVGKRDLCPYGREGAFPEGESTHERCEDLREHTARLVESDGTADATAAASAAIGDQNHDDVWWDPQVASDLAKAARADQGQQSFADDTLVTAGAASPYRRSQPSAPPELTDGESEPLYCPFEADWYARNRGSPVDFSVGRNGVATPDDYLPAATEYGTCPHRVLKVLVGRADVVVGNYNHLFDPDSRAMISAALDERTFVVVDEAHRLEERVRDLLSSRLGRDTLKRARNDCNLVVSRANQSQDHADQVEAAMGEREVPLEAVDRAREFYDAVIDWLDDRVARFLDEEVGRDWRAGDLDLPERDLEVPLRDPETVARDDLTKWAEGAGYDGTLWRQLSTIGAAVEDAIDQLDLARQPVALAVGTVCKHWWDRDHASYLREIELDHAPKDAQTADRRWEREYTAGLLLYECMPGESLRSVFDHLGGGVVMSATLEPLDVFAEVAGLEALREADRPVVERSYELPFPEANRASFVVDATPFTARNRGDPAENVDPETWTRTRDEYAHVLRTLARSPGNVLIAMPNYREAAWAADYLSGVVDKAVLLDESTASEVTDDLKADFFAGPGKVVVTSARGTLTEGVDYDGDKLHLAAVVGVPLVNIGSPKITAVQRAYGDAFGEDQAFEYALTVPAVRRARQAIGRVIRGTEEVGCRVFVGNRYVEGARHSVHEYLAPAERAEFVTMSPEFLGDQLDRFWRQHDPPD